MATTLPTAPDEILDALNSYTGDNIWQDVILALPGYEYVDEDYERFSDVFAAGGVEYRYVDQDHQWVQRPLPTKEAASAAASMSADAARLLEYVNGLDRWPTWEEVSRLGVELVDDGGMPETYFQLATTGEVIYPTETGWDVLVDQVVGTVVHSGSMTRHHRAGISEFARIHPTAHIDPTARIERGAIIGAHAVVQSHAHVGRGARIAASCFVGAGAFVGSAVTLRPGCMVGEGAVIGTGSDIGSTTRIGSGARIAQGTTIDSMNHVASNTEVVPTQRPRFTRSAMPGVFHAVEKLMAMDRG